MIEINSTLARLLTALLLTEYTATITETHFEVRNNEKAVYVQALPVSDDDASLAFLAVRIDRRLRSALHAQDNRSGTMWNRPGRLG